MRTRLEEIPWIVRRSLGTNHLTSGYYELPPYWEQNKERAKQAAFNIRGLQYKPAIFVHGILPRCGSNLVHDIIDLHPSVAGRSIGISEYPVLCNSRSFDAHYANIVARHRRVANHVSGLETMAFFSSGWMRDIQVRCGDNRTALLKMPSVQHIELFDTLFPRDKLVIVTRDGRDILDSTLKSWKNSRLFGRNGSAIAREYMASANDITTFVKHRQNHGKINHYLFRYEDYIENPEQQCRQLFDFLGLSAENSLIGNAASMPVIGSSSLLKSGRPNWESVEKPPSFNTTHKWHKWTPRRRRRFAKYAQQALIDLGYEDDASWISDASGT